MERLLTRRTYKRFEGDWPIWWHPGTLRTSLLGSLPIIRSFSLDQKQQLCKTLRNCFNTYGRIPFGFRLLIDSLLVLQAAIDGTEKLPAASSFSNGRPETWKTFRLYVYEGCMMRNLGGKRTLKRLSATG